MLKVRRIGTLVRALLMGTVMTTGVIATGSVLVGCEGDDREPETHVKRLSDPIKRTAAVERLTQMYNDKMTSDKQDRSGPAVKPLLDVIVQPLADLAEKADLDQKTQGKLLAMLADTRDPRAMKALVKAVDSYKMDDKRPEDFDTNMNDVVRNLGEVKATEASEALLKLFQSTHFSWPKAQNKTFGRTLQDTMTAINDPKWEDGLIKLIEAPIKTLNTKEQKAIADQMYWQTVSALILGNIKSQKAVPALMKVVLSPFKGPVGVTAISALIKIGKPSIDAGVDLLTGKNADLAKYAEEEFLRAMEDKGDKIDDKKKADAKKAYLDNAVIIVSNTGRAECTGPMLAQIETGDETSDAVIARELYKLPKDPKINEAFKKVWEATKTEAVMAGGAHAKPVLTEAAASFADLDLATAIGTAALDVKGEAGDIADVQEAALVMLLKLGGPAQLDLIEKMAAKEREGGKLGKAVEKEVNLARALIKECGDKADCYVKKLESPEAQKDTGFVGIKAAMMAAALGGEAVRPKLVERRLAASNPAVAFTLEAMIDRLAPQGDKDAVEKLQAFIDKAVSSRDEQRASSVSNLKTVVNRLRARAQ
ncbi:MAG: hypothetical protein FJ096_05050 [Deltaproteobacteria bacterium]|nr:hypothetical protein [Deltaproteobacteria bacterium]